MTVYGRFVPVQSIAPINADGFHVPRLTKGVAKFFDSDRDNPYLVEFDLQMPDMAGKFSCRVKTIEIAFLETGEPDVQSVQQ